MNFIRNLVIRINKFFMNQTQDVPRPIIDESKIYSENSEIPSLPKNFIPEPFYSTMFNEDLVETPLFVPGQMPMAPELLEPPQLVDMATDTDKPHSDEDAPVQMPNASTEKS